jgi:uncharacterized membrane protein HdeD (DUF308 family)
MFHLFHLITRYRWVFGARGVLAVLFGLWMFLSSDRSLYSFVMASGFFVLSESLLLLLIIFGRREENILTVAIESGIGAVIGVIILIGSGIGCLLIPSVTSVMVPLYIGSWAILTGVFGFINAAVLRSRMQGLWVLVLSSLLALPFGVWLILQRNEGALSLQWMIAGFAIVYGLLLIFVAIKAKIYAITA